MKKQKEEPNAPWLIAINLKYGRGPIHIFGMKCALTPIVSEAGGNLRQSAGDFGFTYFQHKR